MEELLKHLIDVLNNVGSHSENLGQLKAKLVELLSTPDIKPDRIKEALQTFSNQFDKDLAGLQESLKVAVDLANQIGQVQIGLTPPSIKVDELAKHFGSVIETLQNQARQPRAGDVAATLKSLDVDLKGLIVVEDGEAKIVTPTPQQHVDPGQFSTIRMSFGTIPALRPATPDQPPRSDHGPVSAPPSAESEALAKRERAAEAATKPRRSRKRPG